jgi:hypothetical protein
MREASLTLLRQSVRRGLVEYRAEPGNLDGLGYRKRSY